MGVRPDLGDQAVDGALVLKVSYTRETTASVSPREKCRGIRVGVYRRSIIASYADEETPGFEKRTTR